MRPLPRKAKSAAKPIVDRDNSDESDFSDGPDASQGADFFRVFKDQLGNYSQESDFEETGRKRKGNAKSRNSSTKKAKFNHRNAEKVSLEVPPMSDDDFEEDRPDDVRLLEKVKKPLKRGSTPAGVKITSLPNVLRIEILNGPTTVNINLADLLKAPVRQQSEGQSLEGDTLVNDSVDNVAQSGRAATPESFVELRANPQYACFLELEPDLRNRIYRDLLVRDEPVGFNPCPDLSRTAAILRTCRQVHQEASEILYGENAFHLDRTSQRRGTLYSTSWREVGYKDMRRFIETIGQSNVSKIRFLSLALSDAAPVYSPELTADQRRYFNDPVLHYILRLIGQSGAVLEKFVVDFSGKGALEISHASFIRAFTTITCRQLIKTCCWGHSRISEQLFSQLKEFMQTPPEDNVDTGRRRLPKMQHEVDARSYSCGMWLCRNS